VSRRLARYQEGDAAFSPLPDLMLIDGGAVHAAAAQREIAAAGLPIPVFGMVKDDRHRTRALCAPDGAEIAIRAQPALFSLIGRIQEETHRFAIAYHRKLRGKKTVGSTLEQIPGVGEKRRQALLKHFKSVSAIGQADEGALALVIPKDAARAVYNWFHRNNEKTE